ncbi:hypothetical protein BN1723_020788, partial [Verticillium longisporum]
PLPAGRGHGPAGRHRGARGSPQDHLEALHRHQRQQLCYRQR